MSTLAKTASIAAIVVTALMAAPFDASAATHVGATFTPGTGNSCNGSPDFEWLQTGRASGPSYATPSAGVLTVWSFQADDAVQTVMTLRVFRPTATAHQHQVIADGSELQTIPASSGLHNFPTRVPVNAGDIIGIRSTSGECGVSTLNPGDTFDFNTGTATAIGALGNFTPNLPSNGWIVDISATLEPDVDKDGFGDESQDQCLGQAGTNNGCPVPSPPAVSPPAAPPSQPVTKKKCKKHKHHSAFPAKKKRCKKKKH
jgi:hypothetical protein